ncbi:PA14 domain protein [Caulifigura coniformis]|uniref:PA14 domain protein n=2 Tax=Caulifigura coniformis TaxID=2527983 RepID=A0A517SGD3_9PLAN|nr:PA14 domain protein [Caulifigura coniformis]
MMAAIVGGLVIPSASAVCADDSRGQGLFKERCASCHGEKGEGVHDEFANPLIGDRSLNELSKYIDDTMPKDEADSMNAEDSAAVAAYIYDAFYSPTAQFRNQPARVELARLTVRQYRHALIDVISDFRGRNDFSDERGLKADYGEFLKPRVGDRPENKIEPGIDHVFNPPKDEKPLTEEELKEAKKNPMKDRRPGDSFRAKWRGAIIIPADGEYEFIAETENGVKVFVNDSRTPIIDAAVRSGNETVFRGSSALLGGRSYFLNVEFNKSKAEKSASIVLKWKRPGQVAEPIPTRFLSPQEPPERLVISSSFPPDDRSMGYERGNAVSREWDDATTSAAFEAADWIAKRRFQLANTRAESDDRTDKVKAFSRRFVERVFRRPLSDEEAALYVERQFAESRDDETAVKRVVLLALKSPWFLYREPGRDATDPHAVASRISFTLWDAGPDDQLRQAAAKGELKSREQVQKQVNRMLKDHRADAKLASFFEQWLKLDRMGELSKDARRFPEFTPELVSDLRTSLELFVDEVVRSDASDFRSLFTSNELYANGRIARFYGLDLPEDAPFQKVAVTNEPRIGLLSHPYMLAGFAYHDESSPIHRGVFIARTVLGRMLKQPPVAVAPIAPDLHAGMTTRERVLLQTKPEMCMSCHGMINSLGFSLEHFDAVGRYRQKEHDRPVDSSGNYLTTRGDEVKFADVRGLSEFLANGPESSAALTSQLFHFAVKQPVRAYGADQPDRLHAGFVEGKYSIRRLLGDIAVTAALDQPAEPAAPVAAN